MAKHRQQGVVVAAPDLRPIRRQVAVAIAAQLLVLVALVTVGAPHAPEVAEVVELAGHGQQRRRLTTVIRVGDVLVMLRILKEHPELIADHVGGDLSATHRSADKGAHEILGVIQHELVARPGRNRLEGLEGIGAPTHAVARQLLKVPVLGEEQRLHPRQPGRAERIGEVRLVHDHVRHRAQAVIDVGARIVVGAARGDRIDRLPARRARTHQRVEMPRFAALEIQMRKEQVLVQPAADQLFAQAVAVEEAFPVGDLRAFGCAGLQGPAVQRRALRQPALQGGMLVLAQPGHCEWHAAMRIGLGVGSELVRQWALVVTIDADIQRIGQPGIGRQRLAAAQFQHPRHQRRLSGRPLQHRIKALAPPGGLALGIEKQSRGFLRLGAGAVVQRGLVRAALDPFATAQIELAGRVIAGVAGHALGGEDRLDIPLIGQRLGHCQGTQHQRGNSKDCTTDHGGAPQEWPGILSGTVAARCNMSRAHAQPRSSQAPCGFVIMRALLSHPLCQVFPCPIAAPASPSFSRP